MTVSSWLRGLSIRTRITIGTLVVAVVVSILSVFLLRLNVESIVRATTVQLLHGDAAPFEAAIEADPTAPTVTAAEGQLVTLLDPQGEEHLSNLPDHLDDVIERLRHFSAPQQITAGGTHYLVYNEAVPTSAGRWHVIVARSLEPGGLVVMQLGVTLVIGAVVFTVAFGLAAWLLSGIALRPVGRMRREAQRLADEGSFGSLPTGPARDELADLATTLNDLIHRNRQTLERERQMISDASHELRTPIAVLIAQLQEAATTLGRSRAAALDRPTETAHRLARLASNLLELSRLEAEHVDEHADWTRLAQELARSIDTARVIAGPRDVEVDFEIEFDDGDESVARRTLGLSAVGFGRVVDNLLSNAIAASPAGGAVRVTMATDPVGLRLVVTDDGPGMPEEFIPIALDRFSRPDTARTGSTGGSGLGLAIVAAIVDSAGGDIRLANGQPGLTATVTIPYS